MQAPKKLFLLDAMALIYRAYFAFSNNHRINSKGQNTSAIFGFTNTLLEVLRKEDPTHIAVVFDTAAPTSRHEEFEHYKANRQEIPEDLAASIPIVIQLCEAFNIPVLAMDGYEADDIIYNIVNDINKDENEILLNNTKQEIKRTINNKSIFIKVIIAGFLSILI